MPTKPMNQMTRLKNNIALTDQGCWQWTKNKDRLGYGRLKISLGTRLLFKTSSAHRFAWELIVGEIPEGMCVLHKCDNRACCNPDHLFLGTQQDNMQDMHKKGRGPKGYKRAKFDAAIAAHKGMSHE